MPFFTKLPESVTIVTYNCNVHPKRHKPVGILESGLTALGVPHTVLGKDMKKWNHIYKIDLLHKYLDEVKTEYVISSDSADVFVTNRLEAICDKFDSFGCEALFNSEKCMSPGGIAPSFAVFEKAIHNGCFLNAGLWMARTKFAKELTAYLMEIPRYYNCEQFYYKIAYKHFYPRLQVDARSLIFQGLNHTPAKETRLVKLF